MTPQDVFNYYKNGGNFHRLTGMSRMTLSLWKKLGFVPENAQFKLYYLTDGKLQVDENYKKGVNNEN